MRIGSGLCHGHQADAQLAEHAVEHALERAGIAQAGRVLLFLTSHFQPHAAAAVRAAARRAGCLQVAGCTASGVLTDEGWQADQPAAAALVIESHAAECSGPEAISLSFSGHTHLPYAWQNDTQRAGLLETNAVGWSAARISDNACSEIRLDGFQPHVVISPGLQAQGRMAPASTLSGYDLQALGEHRARESLLRDLPAELRDKPPIHQLALIRPDGSAIALLGLNADGSIALAGAIKTGDELCWGLRQPIFAEREIRRELAAAVHAVKTPKFGMLFSCIGRGSLFYGDEDRDLFALREHFPGLPLIGAYGTGQIIPGPSHNRLMQNTALTLIFQESPHVQSHP